MSPKYEGPGRIRRQAGDPGPQGGAHPLGKIGGLDDLDGGVEGPSGGAHRLGLSPGHHRHAARGGGEGRGERAVQQHALAPGRQ
jgi:hypothetical protein